MTLDEMLWHSKKLYDQLTDENKARAAAAAKQRAAERNAATHARARRR